MYMDSLLTLLTETLYALLKLVSADTHNILHKHKGNGGYNTQLYKSSQCYAPVMCAHNTFNNIINKPLVILFEP